MTLAGRRWLDHGTVPRVGLRRFLVSFEALNMRRPFFTSRFLLGACLFAAAATAQTRTGSDVRGLGNTWAGINQTTSVTATVGSTTARTEVTGDTTGHLLHLSREASSRSFLCTQNGSGNRARVRLVGSTVCDVALPNGVVQSLPMVYRTVFSLRYDILDIGICTIGVAASAGAGTQFTAVARHRTGSNPAAHLSGPFQSYVAGEGSVTARLLGGALGSAKATVRVEGLNTTVAMTLPTERSTISTRNMTMTVDTIAWRFQVKGKLEGPFGINLGSRTFVDVEGPRTVVDVLNR
jgi:hypothetical protein